MGAHTAILEQVSWHQISADVHQCNSELATIIDQLSPGNDLPLVKVTYPYGAQITHHTILHLPNDQGELVPLGDASLDPKLQEMLAGQDTLLPLSLLLQGAAEIYTQFNERVLPWSLLMPGQLLSLWRKLEQGDTFHPAHIFNVTSGARSIFMAPNVGDSGAHSRLKRDFSLHTPPPLNLHDHWEIFRAIAQHPDTECKWQSQLLLFPIKWLELIHHDPTWLPLKCYLYQYGWQTSGYSRNQLFYNYAFSMALAGRNYKPDPYINDTAKHLIAIAVGAKPGFRVLLDDNAAPISLFQQIYLESYGLKKYIPSVIGPAYWSKQNPSPIYYSLQYPTTYEFSPKSRKMASTLYNLSELKCLLDIFIHALNSNQLNVEDTVLKQLGKTLHFDYFHNKPDQQKEVKLTSLLPEKDTSLLQSPQPGREFAESGTFFRGCIQISHDS